MVLNGDIMEYENIGGMDDVGTGVIDVEYAAVELLINFVEFAWMQWSAQSVMRLNGGFDWRKIGNRMATGAVRLLGPQGVDFVARHVFTGRYRKAKEAQRNSAIRSEIKRQRDRQHRRAMKKALNTKAMRQYIYTGRNVDREKTAPPPAYIGADYLDQNPALTDINYKMARLKMERIPSDGYSMLQWKNMLTKKLSTQYFYEMSVILKTNNNAAPHGSCHYTDEGQGPHLYSTYQSNLKDNSKRSTGFNFPTIMDAGTDDNTASIGRNMIKGVGWNHTIYVWAADYPFATMNPDPATQINTSAEKNKGRYLLWAKRGYEQTTDNNQPKDYSDVIFNNDWTYLTHYYTVYHFDFTNTSHMPYVVEILFFKFKADVDAMDYGLQTQAITNKQEFHLQEYINGVTSKMNDIIPIYRKRIYLKGMDNYMEANLVNVAGATTLSAPSATRENSGKWKYVLKNKYVIKRPITRDYDRNFAEKDFFNTYYNRQNGVYCRMQAFSLEGNIVINEDTNFVPIMNTVEDTVNKPTTAEDCTKLGFGVNCYVSKKSRFKLDENMYNQYQAKTIVPS